MSGFVDFMGGFAQYGCTEQCAVPVPCPTCGRDLPPIGRAMPFDMAIMGCCDDARMDRKVNTRHIWTVDELGKEADDE